MVEKASVRNPKIAPVLQAKVPSAERSLARPEVGPSSASHTSPSVIRLATPLLVARRRFTESRSERVVRPPMPDQK